MQGNPRRAARVRTQSSQPVRQGGDEAEGGEEVSSELVIAGGDAAEVLEATEAAFDDIAAFVGELVQANGGLAIGFAGNDGGDPLFREIAAKRIGVIALIDDEFRHARDQTDAGFGHSAIGGVARGEDEDPGSTELVDDRMNLAVSATFGDADRLPLRPPFPPLAQRWIFT